MYFENIKALKSYVTDFILHTPLNMTYYCFSFLITKINKISCTANDDHTIQYKKLPSFILIIDKFDSIREESLDILATKIANNDSTINKIMLYNDCVTTKLDGFPDLIILIDYVQRFNLHDPLLLYKAEIYHSRYKFTKNTLINALKHYSSCEIRNGK
ncbi:hypothetical protein BDAP_001362 [Binucleata daphniae]